MGEPSPVKSKIERENRLRTKNEKQSKKEKEETPSANKKLRSASIVNKSAPNKEIEVIEIDDDDDDNGIDKEIDEMMEFNKKNNTIKYEGVVEQIKGTKIKSSTTNKKAEKNIKNSNDSKQI